MSRRLLQSDRVPCRVSMLLLVDQIVKASPSAAPRGVRFFRRAHDNDDTHKHLSPANTSIVDVGSDASQHSF